MTLQEILFIVSIVFFVLAVIFVGLAIAIFFVRNIPDVRADLSGKKRAEGVARMNSQRPGRDRRRGTGQPSAAGASGSSGAQASSAQPSGPAVRKAAPARVEPKSTTSQQKQAPRSRPAAGGAVAAASPGARDGGRDDSKTSILPDDDQSTAILPNDDQSTSILADDDGSTTILEDDSTATAVLPVSDSLGFVIVRKIVLRESEQVIDGRLGS